MNRLVVRFALEGVAIQPGWRGVISLAGKTQIVADALVPNDGHHGIEWWCLEYERAARTQSRVARKLNPYHQAARERRSEKLLMVCHRPEQEDKFRSQAGDLIMGTSTLREAAKGSLFDEPTVWRYI